MKVAAVTPGGPMDKAGVRAGDVLEAAGEQPLTAMPDWFVARTHFERERAIDLKIGRDEQPLHVHLVITDPAFRAWSRAQFGRARIAPASLDPAVIGYLSRH